LELVASVGYFHHQPWTVSFLDQEAKRRKQIKAEPETDVIIFFIRSSNYFGTDKRHWPVNNKHHE